MFLNNFNIIYIFIQMLSDFIGINPVSNLLVNRNDVKLAKELNTRVARGSRQLHLIVMNCTWRVWFQYEINPLKPTALLLMLIGMHC